MQLVCLLLSHLTLITFTLLDFDFNPFDYTWDVTEIKNWIGTCHEDHKDGCVVDETSPIEPLSSVAEVNDHEQQ